MTTPVLAKNVKGKGRHYTHPLLDGVYPSVTNVIKVYNDGGPGLLGWAAECAIKELYDQGFPPDVDTALQRHKWACNRARNKAADRGDRAHTLAELLAADQQLPSSISDEDEQYADAFLEFVAEHDPDFLYVESSVFNTHVEYAGTADWFARLGGAGTVGDYKTKPTLAKAKAYDQHWLQLAALAFAPELADDGQIVPTPPVEQGVVVFLTPEGYAMESKSRDELEPYFDWFCDLRRVWGHKYG